VHSDSERRGEKKGMEREVNQSRAKGLEAVSSIKKNPFRKRDADRRSVSKKRAGTAKKCRPACEPKTAKPTAVGKKNRGSKSRYCITV